MIVNATKREKEILLMLLSTVDIGEIRPELHNECITLLDSFTQELTED